MLAAKDARRSTTNPMTLATLRSSFELLEAPSDHARRTVSLRLALGVGAVVAVAAGTLHADPGAYLRADPQLGRLLRGMALIKAGLTLVAILFLYCRFARPISRPAATAYLVGVWFMAGASMIVWELTHIGWGALTFHAGELTVLLGAWRENRAVLAGAGRDSGA